MACKRKDIKTEVDSSSESKAKRPRLSSSCMTETNLNELGIFYNITNTPVDEFLNMLKEAIPRTDFPEEAKQFIALTEKHLRFSLDLENILDIPTGAGPAVTERKIVACLEDESRNVGTSLNKCNFGPGDNLRRRLSREWLTSAGKFLELTLEMAKLQILHKSCNHSSATKKDSQYEIPDALFADLFSRFSEIFFLLPSSGKRTIVNTDGKTDECPPDLCYYQYIQTATKLPILMLQYQVNLSNSQGIKMSNNTTQQASSSTQSNTDLPTSMNQSQLCSQKSSKTCSNDDLPNQPQNQYKVRKIIWSGNLEIHEKCKASGVAQPTKAVTNQFQCDVSTNITDPELNTTNWPKDMIMQYLPQSLLAKPELQPAIKNSRLVEFHFGNHAEDSFKILHRKMNSGFSGCVHFPAGTQCEARVLLLLFSNKRKAFIGLIPNDQKACVEGIRQVIKNHKMKNNKDSPNDQDEGTNAIERNIPKDILNKVGLDLVSKCFNSAFIPNVLGVITNQTKSDKVLPKISLIENIEFFLTHQTKVIYILSQQKVKSTKRKGKVTFVYLSIQAEHVTAINNSEDVDQQRACIYYTDEFDIMKSEDRKQILELMFWLGCAQKDNLSRYYLKV